MALALILATNDPQNSAITDAELCETRVPTGAKQDQDRKVG